MFSSVGLPGSKQLWFHAEAIGPTTPSTTDTTVSFQCRRSGGVRCLFFVFFSPWSIKEWRWVKHEVSMNHCGVPDVLGMVVVQWVSALDARLFMSTGRRLQEPEQRRFFCIPWKHTNIKVGIEYNWELIACNTTIGPSTLLVCPSRRFIWTHLQGDGSFESMDLIDPCDRKLSWAMP